MTDSFAAFPSAIIFGTKNCHRPPPLPSVLFVLSLVVPFFPFHCAQWMPPQSHAQRQQQQMPLLTSDPMVHGAHHRPSHLGCVLCISCCCMCQPPLTPQPGPFAPPEQPPLVPQPTPQNYAQFSPTNGGGNAQMQPFHQPVFPSPAQQNQQNFGPFAGSPTAGYLSPSSGPVQIDSTQHQQQNMHQISLSEFGTRTETGGGDPGILRNFQGDQFTDGQRITETRQMNGPFFERIGGEPNYGGQGEEAVENERRKEFKITEKKN
ncbi:hypothetical protein niasHS_010298 [Heterodera schachtii]|uniref:Uncharacterized protein n=1 Tax=Heterodera schachtii TaxID=97005 RepID=A0ABD2IZC7_HETSC